VIGLRRPGAHAHRLGSDRPSGARDVGEPHVPGVGTPGYMNAAPNGAPLTSGSPARRQASRWSFPFPGSASVTLG
jgi:hypothetical protein